MKSPYFRGIVWPRPPTFEIPHQRYVVVGMLVTGLPLRRMDADEIVLSGQAILLSSALEIIPHGRARYPLGDATNVLLNLANGIEEK